MDPSTFAGLPTQIGLASEFAGSWLSNERAKDASKKAYKRAKEFAQSGIQWKVADANAAGINPYFALGAPTATYSDSGIGAISPLGETLSNMGQNISRGALANASGPQKVSAQLQTLGLERAGLENDYLRAKIASEQRLSTQAGSPGGALPVPGLPGVSIPVQFPNLGQTAENHYSDIGGNIYGGLAMLNDMANSTPEGRRVMGTTAKEINAVRSALDYMWNHFPPSVKGY
ncbi:DNA pilot protein [robinz microvirus RP_152]|nr:DNA pilot protein [robinz microvirus RP_152]